MGVDSYVSNKLRLGFVGAGANTRNKHLPGFQSLSDVELYGVCNSSPESTARVAQAWNIPHTYETWQDLVADEHIDAVVVGTWPNLHCEVTCAALEAGKHVLTEARMARNLAEAKQMLAAAQAHPELTSMVVPSPFGLKHGEYLQSIIEHGFLGKLREVVVVGANDAMWDFSQFFHPRQDRELSGNNVLTLGILHETVSRWIPETEQVYAQATLFEPERPVEEQAGHAVATVPDSLQAVTRIAGGARGIYHQSGITLFGPGLQIHLYGCEGTIKVQFDPVDEQSEKVWTGRHGDSEMRLLQLPAERLGGWNVEADFIEAIRTKTAPTLNDFETAIKYMEFTEAVHQSCEKNVPVALPLS